MATQTIHHTNLETREILSPMLLAFLKQKIKELGQEKNEQIIMESIKVVTDEIANKQAINATAIREELEERLKNELATKDFVRAEINQVRTEIAEAKQELKVEIAEVRTEISESHRKQMWLIISTGVISAITIIGANFALLKFLIDTFLVALNTSLK
ncbi:hypothetical protein [Helicobacter winghamensis]|uniref:DUF1640 domain-containing protein n=1 Tax=Helicobacter winghamensis TaxID=157268 RepID=A0A2N3PKA3_9HELI|nr:hypothetical protein [Helicobacter winghamensis]EEO25896.1 hypothetical protein HWAG_00688 [Helicobacter winghamensis ATCC BAA-430]PKT77615.1 hypothetical protein BCM32_05330 [Helicobacter winghamensis]PKT81853.1 hypothetical protein BCM31_01325 [Helicobacter winghamensis]PKT82032.1 hypothetical protein BCM33_00590 [Helicobacter winghamensis]QOQ98572.1 hypothetical protein A0Z60_03090 [Helicobacter winghamensis]